MLPPAVVRAPFAIAFTAAALCGAGCPTDDVAGPPSWSLETAVSEHVPTAIQVTVVLEDGAIEGATVAFGADASLGGERALEDLGDGRWGTAVLGRGPGTDVHLQVTVHHAGGDAIGDLTTARTGAWPADLPMLTAETFDPDHALDGHLLTTLMTRPSAAVIVDPDGRPAWWYELPLEDDLIATRAHLSVDGRSMLVMGIITQPDGGDVYQDQTIYRVALDGSGVERMVNQGAQRDFVELADGTLAMLVLDPREVDGEEQVGDLLVEVAPDGTETLIWQSWDMPVDPLLDTNVCHANSVRYYPDADEYMVGCHRTDTIYRIDRASGEVLWQLGGSLSDYVDPGGNVRPFADQHGFQMLAGGIVVFDNRSPVESSSRAVELRLDHDAGRWAEAWQYEADPPLFCYVMGDVHRFDDGDTLITFSTAGQMDHVSLDGELGWQLRLSMGAALGFTSALGPFPSLP